MLIHLWGAEPSGGSGRPGGKGGEVPVQRTGAPGRQTGREYPQRAAGASGSPEPDQRGDRDRELEPDPLYHHLTR